MPLLPTIVESLKNIPKKDPWVHLFQQRQVPPSILLDLLLSGAVDPAHKNENNESLLDGLAKAFRNHQATESFENQPNNETIAPLNSDTSWKLLQKDAHITHEVLAEYLIASGAEPFTKTQPTDQSDILDIALAMGWEALAQQCLMDEKCPDMETLNRRVSCITINQPPFKKLPWPHALAIRGRYQTLKTWMTQTGMDPNLLDDYGRTPLFYAMNRETVDVLMDAGADPLLKAKDGRVAQETWDNPPLIAGENPCFTKKPATIVADMNRRLNEEGFKTPLGVEMLVNSADILCRDGVIGNMSSHELSEIRITRTIGNKTIEWGLIGFLAWSWFQMKNSEYNMDMTGQVEILKTLSLKLPKAAWLHESLKNVPDIELARLFLESCGRYPFDEPNDKLPTLLESWHPKTLEGHLMGCTALMPLLRQHGREALIEKSKRTIERQFMESRKQEQGKIESSFFNILSHCLMDRTMRKMIGRLILEKNGSGRFTYPPYIMMLEKPLIASKDTQPETAKEWMDTLLVACKELSKTKDVHLRCPFQETLAPVIRLIESKMPLPPLKRVEALVNDINNNKEGGERLMHSIYKMRLEECVPSNRHLSSKKRL